MNEIRSSDIFWDDVIYKVCNGDITNMIAIKKLDVFEFFQYIENRKDAGKRRTIHNKSR